MGCRKKERNEKSLSIGAFGANFPGAGVGCYDLWTWAGSDRAWKGIRPNWGGATSEDSQMELKSKCSPTRGNQPPVSGEQSEQQLFTSTLLTWEDKES